MRILSEFVRDKVKEKVAEKAAESHGKIAGKVIGKAKGAVYGKAAGYAVRKAEDAVVGITGGSIEEVSSNTVVYKPGPKVAALASKLTKEHNEDDLLQESADNTQFIARINTRDKRTLFDVFDTEGHRVYSVKNTLFVKHDLILLGRQQEKIGTVKKKVVALRSPFAFVSDARDYKIDIDGICVGQVKTHLKGTKRQCKITPIGWTVQGDFFESNYTVTYNDTTVARIRKTSATDESYILDFSDPTNEGMVMMIVAALFDVRHYDD